MLSELDVHLVHFSVVDRGRASAGSSYAMADPTVEMGLMRSALMAAVPLRHSSAERVVFVSPGRDSAMAELIVRMERMRRDAKMGEVRFIDYLRGSRREILIWEFRDRQIARFSSLPLVFKITGFKS